MIAYSKKPRRLPPLNALRAFEMASRHMSFSMAAAELNVTQSAISRQIKGLEDYLGIELFKRLPRSLELTEQGARFARPLHDAFDQLYQATETVLDQHRTVTLNINVLPTFAMKWLIPRLPRFVDAHPGVAIRIVEEDSGEPDFGGRGLHAAIRLHQGPAPAGLAVSAFLPQAFGVVVAPALLARVGGEGLLRSPRLHSRTFPDGWRLWAQAAQVELPPPSADRAFEHNSYMLEAAAAGLGAAVTAWAYVEAEIAQGRLVAPWGFVPLARRFALVRPAIARHPGAERFADWLRAEGRAAAPAPRRDVHESGS